MKKKVYVLYGGKSAEHQVSVDSALNVLNKLCKCTYEVFAVYITESGKWTEAFKVRNEQLQREQLIRNTQLSINKSIGQFMSNDFDENSIIFPVLHGTFGEDGKLQGMLEMLDLPYVGNGVVSAAIGMDKVMSKKIFAAHNIPETPYIYFTKQLFEDDERYYIDRVVTEINFPCYVKPANMGSSVGISYCNNELELKQAIMTAFLYDNKILIEKEIVGREIIIGVTGNNNNLICSLAGEWRREQKFFDYDDKYFDENLAPQIPALIREETYEQIKNYAKLAYVALGGAGLMRLDFFVTDKQEIYLNEVNTLPGFTQYSMFPVLFEKTEGLSYSELLDRLIRLGFQAHEQGRNLQFRRVNNDYSRVN